MIKLSNIGSFFEEHVEKIVLVIVGIICAALLITRVILSPNAVTYDDKHFSPSAIDKYALGKATDLRQKLNAPTNPLEPYKPKEEEFLALLDSTIRDVDTSLWPIVPYEAVTNKAVAGVYNLPRIGEVNDVDVDYIRAAAYVPNVEITLQNPYDKAGNEPNDIDLVTVEAKFDTKQLYENFHECFEEYVEEQYADPCLAKPVFAAVNLQRQKLNSDGTWSDWQDVPRAKIDQYRKLFQVTENIQDLPPGGLKVQMLQFDSKQVQIDLLQPQAYQIASAKEEWFPPTLHRKYLDLQTKEEMEEKRQARETEKEQQRNQDESRRTRRADTMTGMGGRTTSRTGSGYSPGGAGGYGAGGTNTRSRDRRNRQPGGIAGLYGDSGRTNDRRRSRNRSGTNDQMMDTLGGLYGNEGMGDGRGGTRRRGPTTNDVYFEFDEVAFNALTDFSKLKEPITFWALDDTLEPKNTYRYRIRLGVFNPVAGTNKVSEEDSSLKNKVILWSGFSDVTKPVEIPGRSYFFARDIQEAAKTITVTVCRYVLGHWYSEDFKVSKGETIGNVMENEIEEDKPQRGRGRNTIGRGTGGRRGDYTGELMGDYSRDLYASAALPKEKPNVPETIDYGTGAVMVDAMSINDWWGDNTRHSRNYYDMLYSYDGTNIEHMPVGTTYWSKDMQTVFNHISKLEREPIEEFKAFGSNRRRSARPGLGGYDDLGGYDQMYDMEMMMDRGGLR